MAKKIYSNQDIERLFEALERGDISDDELDSDGDDLFHYPTREELQADLEDQETLEDDDRLDLEDPPLVTEEPRVANNIDPPIITEEVDVTPESNTDNGTNSSSIPFVGRRLLWRRQGMAWSEEKLNFGGKTDFPAEVMKLETPYEFFTYFFTPELMEKIVSESNTYSTQMNPARPDQMTMVELRKYLGILIFMSVYHYPSIRSYWSNKFGFSHIANCMPVNRFEKLRRFIHFNDNRQHLPTDHPKHDRLHKLRPVLDHLNERFSSVPYEQRLSLDEQMCATKMGHFLKQYLPNKPHKWGFKLFVLCCLLGYAYKFEVYSGKQATERKTNEPEIGVIGNTVIRLTRDVPRNVNHVIYFDNFYTSLPLLYYFSKEGIHCLGTIQRNRLGKDCKLPTKIDVMKSTIPRGTYEEQMVDYGGVDMTAISWKDNKQVVLLSTYVGADPVGVIERFDKKMKKRVPVTCPKIIREYNAHMGGVDLMDSHLGRYKIRVKTKKWYLRIFYHLLDITIINSWILYRKVHHKQGFSDKDLMSLMDFRSELAETLTNLGSTENRKGRPSSSIEEQISRKRKGPAPTMPTKEVRMDKSGHDQVRTTDRRRCQMPGCKLLSYIICKKCNVYLCSKKNLDCFNNFHNK